MNSNPAESLLSITYLQEINSKNNEQIDFPIFPSVLKWGIEYNI